MPAFHAPDPGHASFPLLLQRPGFRPSVSVHLDACNSDDTSHLQCLLSSITISWKTTLKEGKNHVISCYLYCEKSSLAQGNE